MNRAAVILSLSMICATALPQSFTRFVEYLGSLPVEERQAKADSFMKATGSFPVTETETSCHFIYQGSAYSVGLAGDFTGWQPGLDTMHNIAGTDLWYCTRYFESDARLDYKIVVDSTNWILDPKNPLICMSGFGPNSELRMPRYTLPPETIFNPTVPQGTVVDTSFSSAVLGNSRIVKIYLPPGYPDGATGFPVVVFQDGLEYISLANATIIIDNLIAEKQIRPLIAVFVPPVEREPEYVQDKKDLYATFITGELMPAVDAQYRTSRDPADRATMGISNGGNISLYLVAKHPECFRKAAAFSSSVIQEIPGMLAKSNDLAPEFYLDMGKYDINELIPMVDNLVRLIERKGYSFKYYKWHEGHSWGSWKGHLGIALKQFFAY